MATKMQIAAERIHNADLAFAIAAQVGLPYAIAIALLDMESEGKNIWGSDVGGTNSGKKGDVTEADYLAFYKKVVDQGAKSNGVGPLQITWAGALKDGKHEGGFLKQAKEQGLKLWDPADNMRFGFKLIKGYLDRYPNDLVKVGRLYNGKESYGVTFKRVVGEWETRFKNATEEEAPVPAAWYPKATKFEIKPGSNDPKIKVRGAILHVTAGTGGGEAIGRYFRDASGGIESHFMIDKAGKVWQYRDLGHEADANYKANSFTLDGVRWGYVSIETEGLEKGKWNEAQLKAIKELLSWLSDEFDFPLEVPKTPTSKGVGYHVLFGAPGPWTPVAKSCPGPDRVKQFKEILVPWMKGEDNEPSEPEPPKPTLIKLDANVVPGKRAPQVPFLKRLLKAAGYDNGAFSATDLKSNYYGSGAQDAVNRFHKRNPKFASTGSYDPAIGPKGFEELQRQAPNVSGK